MSWFWFWVGPALVLAILSLAGERKRRVPAARSGRAPRRYPPVSLIVPVQGEDEGLRENLAGLASQDYPDYELVIASRSAASIPAGVLPRRATVVLAGEPQNGIGGKVWNLLAAVHMARKGSEVFVFADSDGRPGPGWLRALVAALEEPGAGVATGYRWHIPEPASFWALVRSAWDGVVAGTVFREDSPLVWGGATAIRREVLEGLRIEEFWKQTISDDYAVAAAVRRAGFRIVYAPGALVSTPGQVTAGRFFEWARRQLILTRVHRPDLWWPALAAHVFYCGGMAAGVVAALRGEGSVLWAPAAILGIGAFQGARRARLASLQLPHCREWFRRHGRAYWLLSPVVTWIWLATLLASAFSKTIEWRGVRYTLRPPRWPETRDRGQARVSAPRAAERDTPQGVGQARRG